MSSRKRCRTLKEATHEFVALLDAGQSRQAVACLKRSLRLILSSTKKISRNFHFGTAAIECHGAPEIEQNEDCVSPEGSFVFFNRSLLLRSVNDEQCATAVVLYNMGLVYHRQAIQCKRTVLYKTAAKFYILSQKTATAITNQNAAYHFALWNNLGHVSSHLFQFDRATFCLQSLLKNRARYVSFVAPEDFVMNTLLIAAPGA
jgi:hypothetical protein